jgi:16S rRNA (guanine527-N7)-methyltransferase
MPTLADTRIAQLLHPYYPSLTPKIIDQLSIFLDLLLKWNARTNLTAIRDPEEIVRRHFGESLFAAAYLPSATTLLDLGSGAGFPGIPIQIAHPALHVTLAESQNKKATFLREAVRTLSLTTEVWAKRTEDLPPTRRFDVVTLRAVDDPIAALAEARRHVAPGGRILHLTTGDATLDTAIRIPGTNSGILHIVEVEGYS